MKQSRLIAAVILVMFSAAFFATVTLLAGSAAFAATTSDSGSDHALENGDNRTSDLAADSAEQTKMAVYKFLDDNMLDYSLVEVKDGVLTVTLNSQGNGAVTLKDAQSILHIYEFVHTLDASSNVNDLQLYIYDASGEKIYDLFEADVRSSRVCKDDISSNFEMMSNFISTDSIIATAESLAAEYCDADIESIIMQESPALTGDCLTMVLSTDDIGAATATDCNRLFEELEGYSYTTEEYKQCSITLEDTSGEAILFIGGDFEFGDIVTWINPDEDLDMELGPAPAAME